MAKKGQSSTEFLATYGWALLIMFLILATLVGTGVFNPTRYANEECTFQPNLPCTQYYLVPSTTQGAALSFNITNTMGFPIAIMGYAAEIEGYTTNCFDGVCSYPVYLRQGDSAILTIDPLAIQNAFGLSDFAKIKATIQFKNCQGVQKSECLSNSGNTYFTSGRINLFPRGSILPGGTSVTICDDGEKKCTFPLITGAYEECTNGLWHSAGSCPADEVCVQNTKTITCKSAQKCPAIPPDLPEGSSGQQLCILNNPSSYYECDGGQWSGKSCPNPTDTCVKKGDKIDCQPSVTCDPEPGKIEPANVGDQYCDSNIQTAYYECGSDGAWVGMSCSNPSDTCVDNGDTIICQPSVTCDPEPGSLTRANVGDQYCDSNIQTAYYECGSDGAWVGKSCQNTLKCVDTGDKIECQTQGACAPGSTRCDGDVIQVCQNGVYVDSQSCVYGCEMYSGAAQCAVCEVGTTQCVQGNYFQQDVCDNSGGKAEWVTKPCPPENKCLSSTCEPAPDEPDCSPGSIACGAYGGLNQDKVLICTLDQQNDVWEFVYDGSTPDCGAMVQTCDRAACTPMAQLPDCTPGISACGPGGQTYGLEVWECRGGEMVKVEYCEGDTYCQNGKCVSR